MNLLKAEAQSIIDADYKLSFKIPSKAELKDLRRINRDMSATEKQRAKTAEKDLLKALAAIESGDMLVDNLSENVRQRLRNLQSRALDDDQP